MLEKITLFSSLASKDLSLLEAGMFVQHFAKGSVLVNQGDDSNNLLYLIVSGKLKAMKNNEDGKEILLGYFHPGESFGELSLFDDEPRSATVLAVENSQVALLPRGYFFDCLRENPDMSIELLKVMIKRMRATTEKVSSLALSDVYSRIAKLLRDMASPQGDGRLLTEPLTHQELSVMVGASREMVTRILNDLKRGGYVGVEKHRIEIKKPLPSRW